MSVQEHPIVKPRPYPRRISSPSDDRPAVPLETAEIAESQSQLVHGSRRASLPQEPFLFTAVLVAVLVLGLGIGARFFRQPTVVRLVTLPGRQSDAPGAPAGAVPAVRPAPTLGPNPTPAATTAPDETIPTVVAEATGASPAPPAIATIPPPAATSDTLPGIVGIAARQGGVATVPPPAAGYPVSSGVAAGHAVTTGAPAVPAPPPPVGASLDNVLAQGQRAATAVAQRGGAAAAAPAAPQR